MESIPTISVLIPVFNEQENIIHVYDAVCNVLNALPAVVYEIVFVDDGSTDNTLYVVKKLATERASLYYLRLSRNFGKDNALMAGLQHCRGKAVITLDADLQHPPDLIPEFIKHWQEGYEVVYAYREEKNKHAGFRNQFMSRMYYAMINKLSDVHMENGISDYRIMDRKVIDTLIKMKEDNPFFRGLLKWVGFKQKAIAYQPDARKNGVTKYHMRSLLKLGLHSITSFSTKPLTYAIYLGFIFSLSTLLYIPYVLYSYFSHIAISGWTSMIVTIVFFGGVQLMILGIIGLYLGKVFMQAKQRPLFIISESNFLN